MADKLILTREPPELPTSPLAGKRPQRTKRPRGVDGWIRKKNGLIDTHVGGHKFYDFPLPPSRRPPYNREDPEG